MLTPHSEHPVILSKHARTCDRYRSRGRLLSILLLLLWICSSCRQTVPTAGLWQGTTPSPANPQFEIPNPKSHWLVLDTGGSGGAFGKGDLRHHLHDVVFWNRSLGWTCGYGGVFRTADGGHTWKRMLPGGGWHQVEMSGPEEIWLLEGKHPGGIGKVWLRRSTDGGRSWNEILSGKLDGYRDMFCFENQCWVLANSAVWHSADGGENWREVDFGRGELGHLRPSRISLPPEQVSDKDFSVFILGAAGEERDRKTVLLKSDDSGESWKRLTALPQDVGLRALFFVNNRLGWVGGEQGKLWRTADGGETWQPCHLPTSQRVNDMWFDQTGKGFVAVQNNKVDNWGDALFETGDGGNTWAKALDGAKQINRFYGLGPGQVWFVGDVTGRGSNDLVGILQPSPNRRSP